MLVRIKNLLVYTKQKARSNGLLLSVVLMFQIILDNLDSYLRKREYRKRKLASVLLITMPKSGSMYVYNILMSRLGLRPVITGDHAFPFAPIDAPALKKFALGCAIDQAHYMPTTKNLTLLANEGIDKLVIHVRDPRQALLSWVHYVDKLNERGIVYWEQDFELPIDYFNKTLEEKIDVMIDCFYPHLIDFINKWISYEAKDSRKYGMKVLFTEFKKMKSNPELFFEDIDKFYNINKVIPHHNPNNKDAHSHDRKGEVDEWLQVFNAEQINNTTVMITDEIQKRFNWTRC